MLETYFGTAPTLARLRSGPAGPFLDEFVDALRESGHARSTVRQHLAAAAHLGAWASGRGVAIELLDGRLVEAFSEHLATCACSRRTRGNRLYELWGARSFLKYLRECGVVSAPTTSLGRPAPSVVGKFERWMLNHRGVTASTLCSYRLILVELVEALGAPERFTASTIRGFVSDRAALHGRSRAKTVISAVRMFLRYLVMHGLCDSLLADAVPTVANWRLSTLPSYLPVEDVERIVGAADTATALGRRDRAILLLLARLGLRAGDVAGLRLADVDWGAGAMVVAGKGRRAGRLPLPQDVGDAILAYLADGRPDVQDDHVFVRHRAPAGKLWTSAAISSIVARAAKRANVKMPPRGSAHVLRHSMATTLVRDGVPLPAIQAVLRHKSIETTTLYAKVDVPSLRLLARPWPMEVAPC